MIVQQKKALIETFNIDEKKLYITPHGLYDVNESSKSKENYKDRAWFAS